MRLLPLAVLVTVFALAGCGGDNGSSASSSGGARSTIEVRLSEFKLDPSHVSVDEPGTYTFRAVNDGQSVHALEIEGHGVEEETENIQPGDSADLTVDLKEAGDYELYCPVDDHRAMGMDGSVDVGGAGAGAGATTTNGDEDQGGGYGG
ncbi:MAG TPA: cupredoxin domain-containing protein [Gaiellaceae bacterium]|jgi:plastocyanin|nr:cupredoxin domain-containing protein [Gaiellaceae bacterium]